MTDINDPWLAGELSRAYPSGTALPDWTEVIARAAPPRRRLMNRRRIVVSALFAVVAVVVPSLALSSSLRQLVGFPTPDFAKGRVLVTAPVNGQTEARLWLAPSKEGGMCLVVSFDRIGSSPAAPTNLNGGGQCTLDPATPMHDPKSRAIEFTYGGSTTGTPLSHLPPLISGYVPSSLNATRVELRWRNGRLPLTFSNDYFISPAAVTDHPSFDKLPFYVVAYDKDGREVARAKLLSLSLYLSKQAKDRMRDYVRAHPGRHIM